MTIITQTPKSSACCVYRITFPDGYFYIGSTKNFKQRLSGYRSAFKNSIGNVNQLIAAKSREFDVCYMDIIERVVDYHDQYLIENDSIEDNLGNPLLLNRSKNAFNNSGMTKKQVLKDVV